MLKKVHHIAYIVKNLDEAVSFYVNVFGAKIHHRQEFDARGIEVALFYIGDILFELIMPIKEGTRAYRYLQDNGEGFTYTTAGMV